MGDLGSWGMEVSSIFRLPRYEKVSFGFHLVCLFDMALSRLEADMVLQAHVDDSDSE